MIEMRYNGCPDCLSSAKALMTLFGFLPHRNYRVEFHDDHREDAIYKARPDYLKHFSGVILYNPDTEQWIDLYPSGSNIIASSEENKLIVKNFFANQ